MTSRTWQLSDTFVLRHAGFPFDWLEELGLAAEARAAIARALDAPDDAGARAAAETAYDAERARLRRVLHARAADVQIQEAVFLSSPDMFENVWARYVAAAPARDTSAARRTERQVYAYLQRLCAKNETTSFFGPVGYGDIAGDDGEIAFVPVRSERRLQLAYWAVEALAARAACEPAIWRELPLRRNPLFAVDRDARAARCESVGSVVALDGEQLRLLAAVEVHRDAAAIAAELAIARPALDALAMPLLQAGVLVRRLWFPSDRANTLGELSAALAALPASAAQARWLAQLAELDAARAEVQAATFDARRTLLPALERRFTALAGVPARRAGGKLYTDRLIVNDEASSPFRLRIGGAAARWLEQALAPLLDTAAAAGEQFQAACTDEVIARLAARPGAPARSSFLEYAAAGRALSVPVPTATLAPDPRPIAALPDAAFGEPSDARTFALPDVCLGRDRDGGLRVVLSSLHHHLLTPGWMFAFHSDVERVEAAAAAWLAEEPIPLVELATGRHNKGYYRFPGPRIVHATAELDARDLPAIPAADLQVTIDGGGIRLCGPDGAPVRLYLSLSDLTRHPPFAALTHPPAIKARLSAGAHTPRLDVGDATYQRETWELSLAACEASRGFALAMWLEGERRRLGLPRFVFARVPSERKPFLVDLECPFAIDLLAHHARAGAVQLEEMLPAPDQLWLRDARGRYTFELRMQATR